MNVLLVKHYPENQHELLPQVIEELKKLNGGHRYRKSLQLPWGRSSYGTLDESSKVRGGRAGHGAARNSAGATDANSEQIRASRAAG